MILLQKILRSTKIYAETDRKDRGPLLSQIEARYWLRIRFFMDRGGNYSRYFHPWQWANCRRSLMTRDRSCCVCEHLQKREKKEKKKKKLSSLAYLNCCFSLLHLLRTVGPSGCPNHTNRWFNKTRLYSSMHLYSLCIVCVMKYRTVITACWAKCLLFDVRFDLADHSKIKLWNFFFY